MKYPNWARVGAKLKVRRRFETRGGTVFHVGDVVTVVKRWNGLSVRREGEGGYGTVYACQVGLSYFEEVGP